MKMDMIKESKQGREKIDWGQNEKKVIKSDERCFPILSTHLLSFSSLSFFFPLFLFLPLGLFSLLRVRTGSSQSQVKLVTRVLTFILPHLHLPFCSPAPRQASPSIWHHEDNRRNRRDVPQHSALLKHYMKQYPYCWAKVCVKQLSFFSVDLQQHCSKMNSCMHLTIQTFVCPAALSAWRQ